jgi:hypothetical protein
VAGPGNAPGRSKGGVNFFTSDPVERIALFQEKEIPVNY